MESQPVTPATSTISPDVAQERALDFVHASALQHVVMADRKAGILFTLLSAALLFLFTRVPDLAWPPSAPALLWLMTVVLLILAAALAFRVVLPRMRGGGRPNVVFWGAVARHDTADAFLTTMCHRSAPELGRDKAVHCYELSRICAEKFRLLRFALVIAAVGLLLFLLLLSVGGVGSPTAATAATGS